MQSCMSWKQDKTNKSLWIASTDEKLDYFIRTVKGDDGVQRYAAWVKVFTPVDDLQCPSWLAEETDLPDLVMIHNLFMVSSEDQCFKDFETAQRCCAADMAFRKVEHV